MLRIVAIVVADAATVGSAVAGDQAGQSRLRPFDPDLLTSGDVIRYRDLQRSDFRAATVRLGCCHQIKPRAVWEVTLTH